VNLEVFAGFIHGLFDLLFAFFFDLFQLLFGFFNSLFILFDFFDFLVLLGFNRLFVFSDLFGRFFSISLSGMIGDLRGHHIEFHLILILRQVINRELNDLSIIGGGTPEEQHHQS
jgi:hypothetical protein